MSDASDKPEGEIAALYCLGMCADWAGHPCLEGNPGLQRFLHECADGLRWQRDELQRLRAEVAAAYQRGQQDMRERAAALLNYHAARLRKEDEDNRGIPTGMGHSFEANAGDAWADAIRALPIREAPRDE